MSEEDREYLPVAEGEAAITGWKDFDGQWHNIDAGGEPWTGDEPANAVTYHYVSPAGDDVYYTVTDQSGFEEWDQIEAAIDDSLDYYGVTT